MKSWRVLEGAEGAAKIKALTGSYSTQPPTRIDGSPVAKVQDFSKEDVYDEEGDLIPKTGMLMVHLEDGRRFAVRPSGTEPKIKFYLFAEPHGPAGNGLPDQQARTEMRLDQFEQSLAEWVRPLLEAD